MSTLYDYDADLTRLREQIADTQAAIDRTTAAPVTVDEALDRLRAHLDHVAAGDEHGPAADRLAWLLTSPNLDRGALNAFAPPTGGPGLREFFIAAMRPALEAWVAEAVRARDQGAGIDAATRTATLARLRAEQHELEVDEERLVMRAERDGVTLERRHDLDVEVFLTTFEDDEDASAVA